MLTIGTFARLAGVSVRMLRHYDQLGLLRPARVDPHSGYRLYSATQLDRANRLVALKDLAFSLDEVGTLLDSTDDTEVLRLLQARRDDLAASIAAESDRLRRVEARLRTISQEDTVSANYRLTRLPALQLGALTAPIPDMGSVGAVVGPLFEQVNAAVRPGVQRQGPGVAYYDLDGDTMIAGVAVQLAAADVPPELHVVDLPAVERGISATYSGEDLSGIQEAWQGLMKAAEAEGLSETGPAREIYLRTPFDPRSGDGSAWVIDLQQPLA